MNNTVALVLAGGDSTRLWPLKQKITIDFLGASLIQRTVKNLLQAQFPRVIVVAHPTNKETVQAQLAGMGDNVQVVEQTDEDGMAGAVRAVAADISGKPLVVIGASDYYEETLYRDLAAAITAAPDKGIIAGKKVTDYFPGGYLTIADGWVTAIVEKPLPDKVPSDAVALVCDYFPRADELVAALTGVSSDRDDTFEQALQQLLTKHPFRFLPYTGMWGYVKYPWHMLPLAAHLLSGLTSHRGANVQVHPTAVISGPVVLGDGVRVLEYAKIVGPCYIGANTIIGNGTMIRDSVIGENCVVGFGTEITRSVVGRSCWFHKNYLGDSILADHVYFGAGTITANYRLDAGVIRSTVGDKRVSTDTTKLGAIIGTQVHVGINTSIMPGVKIGANSLVGAGIVLDTDLPEASFCTMQRGAYVVKKNTQQKQSTDDAAIREKLTF